MKEEWENDRANMVMRYLRRLVSYIGFVYRQTNTSLYA